MPSAACASELDILPCRDGYTHGDAVYTVGQCTISQDTTSLDPSGDRSVVSVSWLSHEHRYMPTQYPYLLRELKKKDALLYKLIKHV